MGWGDPPPRLRPKRGLRKAPGLVEDVVKLWLQFIRAMVADIAKLPPA